jgi:hypothetical protein
LGLFNLNDLLNGFFLFFLEVSLRRIIGVKVVLFDLGCGGKREIFMQSLATSAIEETSGPLPGADDLLHEL